jgi:hypothetical protein
VTLRQKLPSVGFVFVLLSNLLLVAFLAWGFQKPPLDRVWELHHELKIGALGKLDADDHSLLSSAMTRHRNLAEGLLSDGEHIGVISANWSGWLESPDATIIRSARAGPSCVILLDARVLHPALPLDIEVSGRQWQRRVTMEAPGSRELPLPATDGPEIITLRMTSKGAHGDEAALGLHVAFECRKRQRGGEHD